MADIMEVEDLSEDLAAAEVSPEDLEVAGVREDAAELQPE